MVVVLGRFGGVIERPLIAEKADWFVRDIKDLLNALDGDHQ